MSRTFEPAARTDSVRTPRCPHCYDYGPEGARMGRITGLRDGLPSSPEAVCQVARKEDYQRVLLNVINELGKH